MRTKEFFDEVQARTIQAGFALVSHCKLTNKDSPYHIPVDWAIHTNFAFHKPGKCFLVSLQHEIYRARDETSEFWQMETFLLYPQCWLGKAVPGYEVEHPLARFRPYGRMTDRIKSVLIEQTYNSNGPLEPFMVAASVEELWTAVGQHLEAGKFPYLWTLGLSPHYTFKNSDDVFWPKFDVRYLRQTVANYLKGDYFNKKFAKKKALTNPER